MPEAGAMELEASLPEEHQPPEKGPTRVTEVLVLPKVDRSGQEESANTPPRKAPATPARNRPEEPSVATTPATGTKSKAERRQEKKAARKEEKRNKRAEKSARKAEKTEKAQETPSASKMPVRRKLDVAMENAGSIESVLLLEREYKALQHDPSHRPNFFSLSIRLSRMSGIYPGQYSAPRQGKKKGLSLPIFERQKKPKQLNPKLKLKYRMMQQHRGNASLTNWSKERKLWKKKALRSRRRLKMKQSVFVLWEKLSEELRSKEPSRLPKSVCLLRKRTGSRELFRKKSC